MCRRVVALGMASYENVREEWDRVLEDENAYWVDKEEFDKKQLEKEIAMKPMKRSVVHLEMNVKRLETDNSLSMKASKELVSCSAPTTTSIARTTEILLKRIPFVYLGYLFDDEKAILRFVAETFLSYYH